MDKKHNNRRELAVYAIFACLFVAVFLKIFYLQVFRSNFFQNLAQNQHYRLVPLEAKRGSIFDRQGRILAAGINYYSVFADPLLIVNPKLTTEIISSNLKLPKAVILSKLKKKNRFAWIKRKISLEEKEKLRALNIEGIGFIREQKRFYPQESLAASVVGIVDIDSKGLEGLELFYNNYLSGKDGWARVLQDSSSREIIISSQVITPQEGADIVLTIDAQMEYWVENCLESAVRKFDAQGGSAIIMDASSGEILALANYPSFNPNHLVPSSLGKVKNKAICDMFEPGSVFKIVTLISSIAENKFSDEDKIFCENGAFKIPGSILHDWKPYGTLSFKEVFMKSSNIGVAKVANSVGPKTFHRYVKLLGFGELTGIDLPGEIRGDFKPLKEWSKTSPYIIPIGQEIGVNLVQLARAFATIPNGGYLVKPFIVKSICSRGFCKTISPQKQKIFSSSIADRAKNILLGVVESGTGKSAAIKGRKIGGKTGTAQKYDPATGSYSPTRYRATFIGFIADLDPPLVIAVTIDEPRKSHFGGVVAAPVFKEISQKIINYIEGQGRQEINDSNQAVSFGVTNN